MTETEEKTSKTTVAELGATLPLGVKDPNGKLHRSFEVRPWRLKEEKELGQLQKSIDSNNMALYVQNVVGYMLTRIGEFDFTDMAKSAKDALISQMYLGDVWYIYLWTRIEAMGEKITLTYGCPHCRKKNLSTTADLTTAEVVCVADPDSFTFNYKLKRPIKIRNKEATELLLGPVFWNSIATSESDNRGAVKADVLVSSIRGIPGLDDGKQIVMTEHDILELTKRDIEGALDAVNQNAVGPIMVVEMPCVACGSDVEIPIDWNYNSFFEASSD